MPHDINQMVYAGKAPWHGLGTPLPHNASYEEIAAAAGFYRAVQRDVFVDGNLKPVPDKKALVREDDGRYLATVGRGYEVVKFEDVARCVVEAAGGVGAIFHTAGTLGRNGLRGWLLGELPGEMSKSSPIPVMSWAAPIE